MKKFVQMPIKIIVCDTCGQQVPEYYIFEDGHDYCSDYCKQNKQ